MGVHLRYEWVYVPEGVRMSGCVSNLSTGALLVRICPKLQQQLCNTFPVDSLTMSCVHKLLTI